MTTAMASVSWVMPAAAMWREPRPRGMRTSFLLEIEVATGGQHHAVLAQHEGAVEHGEGAQRPLDLGVEHVALVLGVALERIQAERPRLLHDLVRVADDEQRAHRPAFPAFHTDGDGQVDERFKISGDTPSVRRKPKPTS
jgi:hypothetical protein